MSSSPDKKRSKKKSGGSNKKKDKASKKQASTAEASSKSTKSSDKSSPSISPPVIVSLSSSSSSSSSASLLPNVLFVNARLADSTFLNDVMSEKEKNMEQLHSKTEEETNEIMRYLEHEIKRKDRLTKQMSKEIKQLRVEHKRAYDEKQAEYKKQIEVLQQNFQTRETHLLTIYQSLLQEYHDLILFSKIQHDLQRELESTKVTISKNEMRHRLQMEDLENKFLYAQNKLQHEANERIVQNKALYKAEIHHELDMESLNIQKSNDQITVANQFHTLISSELLVENEKLNKIKQELAKQKKQYEELDSKFAQQSLKNNMILRELKTKLTLLKDSYATLMQEHKEELAKIDENFNQEHNVLENEVEQMRKFLHDKSNENLIFQQQLYCLNKNENMIEKLFFQAYETVKQEIFLRKVNEYKQQKQLYLKHQEDVKLGAHLIYRPYQLQKQHSFTSSSSSSPSSSSVVPPTLPPDYHELTLADYTLIDREKVLQILFTTMNQPSLVSSTNTASATPAAAAAHDTRIVSQPASRPPSRPTSNHSHARSKNINNQSNKFISPYKIQRGDTPDELL